HNCTAIRRSHNQSTHTHTALSPFPILLSHSLLSLTDMYRYPMRICQRTYACLYKRCEMHTHTHTHRHTDTHTDTPTHTQTHTHTHTHTYTHTQSLHHGSLAECTECKQM